MEVMTYMSPSRKPKTDKIFLHFRPIPTLWYAIYKYVLVPPLYIW